MHETLLLLAGTLLGGLLVWFLPPALGLRPPAGGGTDTPAPQDSLDLHLCLNALGRLTAPLVHDEATADGVEHLSELLASTRQLERARASTRSQLLVRATECHWRLLCWNAGVQAGGFQLRGLPETLPADTLRQLAPQLRSLLAEIGLEGLHGAELALACELTPPLGPGGLRNLRCTATVAAQRAHGLQRERHQADWPVAAA